MSERDVEEALRRKMTTEKEGTLGDDSPNKNLSIHYSDEDVTMSEHLETD